MASQSVVAQQDANPRQCQVPYYCQELGEHNFGCVQVQKKREERLLAL